MPTTLAVGAFVLGGVLLLISIVRGNFKLFGAEISGSAGGGGRVIAFLAGIILIVTGFLKEGPRPGPVDDAAVEKAAVQNSAQPTTADLPASPEPVPAPVPATGRKAAPAARSAAIADAEVLVEWRTATEELVAIVQALSDEEKMTLGLNVLRTGQDVYAIRVRITNTGSVPVRVSPDHVRLTFNGTNIPLNGADDPRFLQVTDLQPNQYAQGILTFKALVLVAGAVLSTGRLSYQDETVRVTFSR